MPPGRNWLARRRAGSYIRVMRFLRKNRLPVGAFVALILFATGGLPGALAAAAGPQPAFPVCSPDGTKIPGHDADESAHCGFCAHFAKTGPAILPDPAGVTVPTDYAVYAVSPIAASAAVPRWELTPLSGRGPPRPV